MTATPAAPASKGGCSPGHPCWHPVVDLEHASGAAAEVPTTITAALTLVFPCYNEEERLPRTLATYLECLPRTPGAVEILVVDDGSSDGTSMVAATIVARDGRVQLIRSEQHRGNGFAVRKGVLAASGDLVVFTDADGSYGPGDVDRIVAALADAPVAIGSRDLGSQATSPTRQLASRLFNQAMRTLLGLPFRDTQCGLKGFRRQAALELFRRATLHGFAFDAEVLYLARRLGLQVAEVGVSPEERDGSKVRIAVDALAMLGEALKVRQAAAAGAYDHGVPVASPLRGAGVEALDQA
jgi:glycosyltransferase involved in cell wall biosynthesis